MVKNRLFKLAQRLAAWGTSKQAFDSIVGLSQVAAVIVAMTAVVQSTCAMRQERRAWVGVKAINSAIVTPGRPVLIAPVLTNSGSSPALEVELVVVTKIAPAAIAFVPTYEASPSNKSSFVMFPGAEHQAPTVGALPLTVVDFERIQSGRGLLYTYGRIGYRDIFGTAHETTFCFRLTDRLLQEPNGPQTWTACPTYNAAD